MSCDTERSDRRRRQGGAIHYAAPAVLLLMIAVGTLAVDVGRMAWNKRELQAVADIAAIDALRGFGQCRESAGDPVATAQASALRNGYDGDLGAAPNVVEVGRVTTAGFVREFTAGGVPATATAVRVLATRQVPYTLLASALLPGTALLQAEAVASREAEASLRAGSFLTRFDPGSTPLWDDVLGGLVGGDVTLDVLSYENLAGANVRLGDLAAAAGVGTPEELLALELTAAEYFGLVATALSNSGEPGVAATMNDIAGVTDGTLEIPLSDVFDIVSEGNEAALEANFNAFDLLAVGAQVARGDTAIVIDPLSVAVPGVTSTGVRIRIVQAPQLAEGPPGRNAEGEWNTTVRTGQVRMAIEMRLEGVLGMLGNQPVSVDLFVEAAPTFAHLRAIDCADASDPVHRVVVAAEPGLVRLGIGRFPDFENSPDPEPSEVVRLTLLGAPIADVTASADVPFQSSGIDLRFDGPFVPPLEEPSEDNTQSVGSPVGDSISTALASLLDQTELDVVLLGSTGLPVSEDTVLSAVADLLDPVLTDFDEPLTALFEVLGLTLGGADVTIVWLDAEQPALAR